LKQRLENRIFNNMDTTTSIPLTNQELTQTDWPLRIKATEAEYWGLLEKAEYRADYFQGEIVATMSYESEIHSEIVTELMFHLKIFLEDRSYGSGTATARSVSRPAIMPSSTPTDR